MIGAVCSDIVQDWSYYKTGLTPTKFGLGLVSCGLGLSLVSYDIMIQGAFRWQLRTTQCQQ